MDIIEKQTAIFLPRCQKIIPDQFNPWS